MSNTDPSVTDQWTITINLENALSPQEIATLQTITQNKDRYPAHTDQGIRDRLIFANQVWEACCNQEFATTGIFEHRDVLRRLSKRRQQLTDPETIERIQTTEDQATKWEREAEQRNNRAYATLLHLGLLEKPDKMDVVAGLLTDCREGLIQHCCPEAMETDMSPRAIAKAIGKKSKRHGQLFECLHTLAFQASGPEEPNDPPDRKNATAYKHSLLQETLATAISLTDEQNAFPAETAPASLRQRITNFFQRS